MTSGAQIQSLAILLIIAATSACALKAERALLKETDSPEIVTVPFSTNPWLVENSDQDTDGDGLSDFQETYKYFTDPTKTDSDGDRIADGDWNERKEFSYSITNRMEILKPFDLAAMNSDYQDTRLIEDKGTSSVVEITYYPLNTVKDGIKSNANWRQDYASMTRYLNPTKTANWDQNMRVELLSSLRAANIDVTTLGDKELVEKVSAWIMNRDTFGGKAPYVSYFVNFTPTGLVLREELRQRMIDDNPGVDFSDLQSQLRLGLFGRTMFEQRQIGSCTPSAILFTTVLRALGIPTRIILTTPAIDANDDAQFQMVGSSLTHNVVKQTMIDGFYGGARGWASHTYTEVFVGGRWVKLNYSRLGQNSLDVGFMGLMTQVNTLVDWSDANYTDTWGIRFSKPNNESLIPRLSSRHPYMSQSIKDSFPKHGTIDNPQTLMHNFLTAKAAYLPTDGRVPAPTRAQGQSEPYGTFYLELGEYLESRGEYQYREFLEKYGERLDLVASDGSTIPAIIDGFMTAAPEFNGGRPWIAFSAHVPAEDIGRLLNSVRYRIKSASTSSQVEMRVASDVVMTFDPGSVTPPPVSTGNGSYADTGSKIAPVNSNLTAGSPRIASVYQVGWFLDPGKPDFGGFDAPFVQPGMIFLLIQDPNVTEYRVFSDFLRRAAHDFVLKATGQADVHARIIEGSTTDTSGTKALLALNIEDDLSKLVSGTRYQIVPLNNNGTDLWNVPTTLSIAAP